VKDLEGLCLKSVSLLKTKTHCYRFDKKRKNLNKFSCARDEKKSVERSESLKKKS
jgi:hypothetical protein